MKAGVSLLLLACAGHALQRLSVTREHKMAADWADGYNKCVLVQAFRAPFLLAQ